MSVTGGKPAPNRSKVKKLPTVIEARCKGCGYCIQFCPKDVLAFSDKFNAKGYYVPVTALPEACTGCGMCEMVCPDFAIYLVEDPAAAADVPVKVKAAEESKS
ncbi:4Fe-4S binding protein [bacterium]|nr:4Fe-4S binding protein [bacterium]